MSTGTKDYYALLGVSRDATESEIKKAFRHKARETHPDVCKEPDAEERFKAINEAYDVLSDPQKRSMYDQYGTVDPRGVGAGPDLGDLFAGFGMDDLFSAFFGGVSGGGRRARTEGRDIGATLTITLEEAATGVTKEVVLNRLVTCDECGGTGSADGTGSTQCRDCGGVGQRQTYRKTFLGTMATMAPCETCAATGNVVTSPCEECTGQGRVPDREHIDVEIPAGIDDGMQIRLREHGEAGVRGAASGDLIVTVLVAQHEFLHRQGDELHCRAAISVAQAALGAEIEVCGITEDNTAKIPAGSQHGDTVRLRGEGMPRLRGGGRGDLIVHLAVEIPRKLDKRQRELFAELGESLGDRGRKSPLQRLHDWLSG
ncbi:MAG: molecular chaperone DnaJ [Coriobacteriia bacterium]|nr:molecular chaperone DnaJ [Coriobacteriia bacterium]